MRVSQPLRQRGKKTIQWERWRAKSRAILISRSTARCEVTGMQGVAREGHHLFNRSDEPWSSHPAAMVLITVPLHRDFERELLPVLHDERRWMALVDLADAFDALTWYHRTNRVGETPMDAWRRLTAYLHDNWGYDPDSNAIVRRPA